MKFKVTIEKWLRGDISKARLLNRKGEMCCLGFAARDCGVPESALRDNLQPVHIRSKFLSHINGILIKCHYDEHRSNSDFAFDAMFINDNPDISDTQRMKQLRALAKKHGHQFVFVHEKSDHVKNMQG